MPEWRENLLLCDQSQLRINERAGGLSTPAERWPLQAGYFDGWVILDIGFAECPVVSDIAFVEVNVVADNASVPCSF